MLYKKVKPSAFLLPFVDSYFFWEDEEKHVSPFEVESPPSGYTAFVFNYGDAYDVYQRGTLCKTPPAFLAGQATCSYKLSLQGRIAMAGIVFKPAAVSSIFGFSLESFTNQREDLSAILGGECQCTLEKLYEATSLQERYTVLENFLSKQIRPRILKTNFVDSAVELLIQQKGKVNIKELAEEVHVCTRHFQRSFSYKVGLNPKEYAVLLRLSNVCNLLIHRREINWYDVLVDAGYYDQAHFIKDFSSFIGRPPSSYYKQNQELASLLK